MTTPSPIESGALTRRLARLRVPLGFVFGVVVLWLAEPSRASLAAGAAIATAGEAIRFWAAGHVRKSAEVTSSGPYRWVKHPLYVGSAVIGTGLAVAAASVPAAVLVAVYLAVMITAAIRREEAWLRRRFGDAYDRYSAGGAADRTRRFSLQQALGTNREYRAILGLAVSVVLLAAKAFLR